MAKHVIIGCGPAALSAVEAIRKISENDEIRLITKEDHLPYSPSVLPYLLAGRVADSDIWLKDDNYFNDKNIEYLPKREVVNILPATKEIIYSNNSRDAYEQLLIATGAKPVIPTIKGLDNTNCFFFHTMEHYLSLKKRLKHESVIAIYGAGLVAIELVIALMERGLSVIWIMRSRVLRKYVTEQISLLIADTFSNQGAKLHIGSEIKEIQKINHQLTLSLTNGEEVVADTLVIAAGVEANIDMLKKSPIKTNKGVIVDREMMSNVPNIYAAGDVAEAPSSLDDEMYVNPILPNALEQGKIAGANMAGRQAHYRGSISMNIIRFFGNSLISIGSSTMANSRYQVFEERKDELKQYKRFAYDDDKLVGTMLFNTQIDPGVLKYLIENKLSIISKEEFNKNTNMISHQLMLKNERQSNS
ncbi:NAD(P)/FAD-dependent oxidoreductase [Chloroflexota bacterium]